MEEEAPSGNSGLAPFTEAQLRGFYDIVEREKEDSEWLENVFFKETSQVEKDELHGLVLNYLRARLSSLETEKGLKVLWEESESKEECVWVLEMEKVEEEGECEDGVRLKEVHEYVRAEFRPSLASSLHSNLKEGLPLLRESHSLSSYKTQLYKLKITDHIKRIIQDSSTLGLRVSLNVLFDFQRKLITDQVFLRDTRYWLEQLVAAFLKESSDLKSHLFLFHHLLRCPSGVGAWGGHFIQPPKPCPRDPFDSDSLFEHPYLCNILSMLGALLRPIKEREAFLKEFKITSGSPIKLKDNVWVVLDPEGEEDEDPSHSWSNLRESDLVTLLAQIPLESIYEYILRIKSIDGEYVYDPGSSSEYSFLKLFAFSSHFVYLLRDGLATFNTPKFRQFARRLGRMIRHTVEYVSDHWGAFKLQCGHALNPSMLQRFQIEYDHFFLRATMCIFSSQKLGAWQYLAMIPYETISLFMLWRIFYILHLDYRNDDKHLRNFAPDIVDWTDIFTKPDFIIQFEEKFSKSLAEEEGCYLLTTFSNMAVSRDGSRDQDFIERAALDLFHIGFINEETSALCMKSARDFISIICTKHPFVMSSLVKKLNIPGVIESLEDRSLYLIKELPLNLWMPEKNNFAILLALVRNFPLESLQSLIGREMLFKLNYDYDGLSLKLRQQLAIMIVEVSVSFGVYSTQDGIIKQMSNIINRQRPEQCFIDWAWKMMSLLRIHAMTRKSCSIHAIPDDLIYIPSLYSISREMKNNNPLACYLSLQGSVHGHSVPEIYHEGLKQVKQLIVAGYYEESIDCLMDITLLFLPCPTSIVGEDFHYILSSLICVEQSYLRYAKDLIINDFPDPILSLLTKMIVKQMSLKESLGYISNEPFLKLWMDPCLRIFEEKKDKSVLYFLNFLCREAFFDPGSEAYLKEYFRNNYEGNQSLSSWYTYFSWKSPTNKEFESLFSHYVYEFPWYAYFILEVDEEYHKPLWNSLVQELKSTDVTLLAAFKRVCAEMNKKGSKSKNDMNNLPIYKWSNLIISTSIHHPLFLVLVEKFFFYYLIRPLSDHEGSPYDGVGKRFFEGFLTSRCLNSIKSKLCELSVYSSSEVIESKFHLRLKGLIKAYEIWIKEPKVLENNLHVPSLPPTYYPNKLGKLIMGTLKSCPIEMINVDKLEIEKASNLLNWDIKYSSGVKKEQLSEKRKKSHHAATNEKIVQRLHSYDEPLASPTLLITNKNISDEAEWSGDLILNTERIIESIAEYAESFYNDDLEYTSLNCSYLETLPLLYKNIESEVFRKTACSGTVGPKKEKFDCSGTAPILLKFTESRKDEVVDLKISQNRQAFKALINRMMDSCSVKVMNNIVFLDNRIMDLLKTYTLKSTVQEYSIKECKDIGVELFYSLSYLLTETVASCPPVRHWLSTCLETLGQVFIAGDKDQCVRLLRRIISKPLLFEHLTPALTPIASSVDDFYTMYEMIVNINSDQNMVGFVLLSKMSINDWCRYCSTRHRSQLISLIINALKKSGIEPFEDRLMIHGLYRYHLSTLVVYEFPIHFEEAIISLLKLTKNQQLDPEVWFDLLKSLLKKALDINIELEDSSDKWTMMFADFARQQTFFHRNQVINSQKLFYHHFRQERLEVGLHGLYTKYKNYVTYFAMLFDLFGHTLVTSSVNFLSTMDDELTYNLWSEVLDLFHPWLIPLMGEDKKETASWIQQMADCEQIFLPWAPEDSKQAQKVVTSFCHVISHMMTMPQFSTKRPPLAILWSELYCKKFAHPAVKDYILCVVHNGLSSLKWNTFVPTQSDIEMMVKIIDAFLPPCHVFLGNIFIQISWKDVLNQNYCGVNASQINKFISAIVKLIVQLAAEPQIRQMGSLLSLLNGDLENFPWYKIEESNFESLMQWYVMSVDCMTVLDHPKRHPLDAAVIRLLKIAVEEEQEFKSNKKRQILVKCLFRLLRTCGSKHRNFLFDQKNQLIITLRNIFEDYIVKASSENTSSENCLDEVNPLVRDFLEHLNASQSSPLPSCVLKVILEWIKECRHSSVIVISLLSQLGPNLVTWSVAFSRIAECSIDSFFNGDEDLESNNPLPKASWEFVLSALTFSSTKVSDVLDVAVKEGHLLVLVTFIRQEKENCKSIREEEVMLSKILDWFKKINIKEENEPKLPLLYIEYLELCNRQLRFGDSESKVVKFLLDFLTTLTPFVSDSGVLGNILGVVGLSTQYKLTPRSKFLALSLMLYIYAQITDDGKIRKIVEESKPDDDNDCGKERKELTDLRIQMYALKQNKAYRGLADSIDWVIDNSAENFNTLDNTKDFISSLVVDKLYVEPYLKE